MSCVGDDAMVAAMRIFLWLTRVVGEEGLIEHIRRKLIILLLLVSQAVGGMLFWMERASSAHLRRAGGKTHIPAPGQNNKGQFVWIFIFQLIFHAKK